jgi:Queuosine salvage protein
MSLPDDVRAACARVAERARLVRIDHDALAEYQLPIPAEPPTLDPETHYLGGSREDTAAFVLSIDAINFGSGWWPTIRKRPGHNGYATMAAGVSDRFNEAGPWSTEELQAMDVETIAAVVGQDPEHALMAQFAAALRDVGTRIAEEHGDSFLAPAGTADSIPALAGTFAAWDAFADISTYEGRPVPFFKRAQLAAADLHRTGIADLPGLDRLTAFADNLVPHVLRVDGILQLDPDLTARIEAEELLDHGSAEEVELRACAVHAIELLSPASSLTPAEIDSTLWNRGRDRRYKSLPRPRSRNTAY